MNGLLFWHGITGKYSFSCLTREQSVCCLVYKDGRVQRLTRPMDFRAEICGLDRLKGLDYIYYVQPVIDVNVKQCVSSCPNVSVRFMMRRCPENLCFLVGCPVLSV